MAWVMLEKLNFVYLLFQCGIKKISHVIIYMCQDIGFGKILVYLH